jgi:hypothetical protein
VELHSHKASKKAVLDEIQRTLKAYEGVSQSREVDTQDLETTRSQLNAYARDMHQPLGTLALSPFAALSRTIAVADAPEADCQIADPLGWSPTQLSNALKQLHTLDRWRARIGDEVTHPWRDIGLTTFDLLTRERVQRSLQALIDALRVLQRTSQTLAQQLGSASADRGGRGGGSCPHSHGCRPSNRCSTDCVGCRTRCVRTRCCRRRAGARAD